MKNEFSRLVSVRDLPAGGISFVHDASEAERAALTQRFGIVAIARLHTRGNIFARSAGDICLTGEISAHVRQSCVVTLEPVESLIDGSFERTYRTGTSHHPSASPVEDDDLSSPIADGDDWEPLAGDSIDVGEVAAEELALALDPYPRRKDAQFTPPPEVAGE